MANVRGLSDYNGNDGRGRSNRSGGSGRGMGTLGDLSRRTARPDEDEQNEYYTGGEKRCAASLCRPV
eukprot:scaffold1541_cov418-Prasinococcus_capsulatus_cf.AAC.17